MHKYIKHISVTLAFFALCTLVFAKETMPPVQMADTMRSNGKIFVVVAVIVTLFAGFVLYLISLDRKISRLEKESGKA